MAIELNDEGIELGIVVRDTGASVAFYRDVLRLELTADVEFPGNHMWRFRSGQSVVKLLENDPTLTESTETVAGIGMRYVTMFVEDIETTVAAVAAAGLVHTPIGDIPAGARSSFVRDPDGNHIELLQLHPG